MTLIMALAFLLAGILCVRRPEPIALWIAEAVRRASPGNAAAANWLRGRGVIVLIRLLGLLALLNAVTLFYISSQTPPQ